MVEESILHDPTSNNILYFPHIEIADSSLLKSALCVWDIVYRIVPAAYEPNDSDEVREAIDRGRLRDIHLKPDDLVAARNDYLTFLESLPFLPDALDPGPQDAVALIHQEKMDQILIQKLSNHLGAITRNGDWIELP